MADALGVDWTGKPCPKCGYVRAASDSNPAWQCPRCQVAYAKVAAAAAPMQERIAAHAGAMAERASSDHSLASLALTNVFALVVAWVTDMTLRDLMLIYWIQSVVIGLSNVVRILKLRHFATAGLMVNGKPVTEGPGTKYQVAGFFALHYGFFHFVYFMFIVGDPRHHADLGSPLAYALIALSFVVNHAFSLRHNIESDASGRPNIGTLMFMPYLRILPMHLTIIFGLGFAAGARTFGFLLFGGLKTVADCVMHLVEHHVYAQNAQTALDSTGIVADVSDTRPAP